MYYVKVFYNGKEMYLFNKRLVLFSKDMSKKFNNSKNAELYFKSSEFSECVFEIVT